MKRVLFSVGTIAVARAASGGKDVETPEKWAYPASDKCAATPDSRCGTNEWHTLDGVNCGEVGTQSPIDITGGTQMKESKLTLHNEITCDEAYEFVMNPHTNQVNIPDACKDKFVVTHDSKKYSLLQFHFHSPSEHTIDGKYFPMEAHYVHKADDGQLLIIASMVAVGGKSETDTWLSNVFDKMPSMEGVTGNTHTVKADYSDLNPYKFVSQDVAKTHYEYIGSLTTPPCTGGEQWVIAGGSVSITQHTLDRYRKGINANPDNQLAIWKHIHPGQTVPSFNGAAGSFKWDESLSCNSRPVQKLHGKDGGSRVIAYAGSPTVGGSGMSWGLIIGICAAVLVVGGAAVFFLKKKNAPEEPEYTNARELQAGDYRPLLAA